MKIVSLLVLAGVLTATPASADITLGGVDQIDVPLRYIPSLGEFIQAYVNGHGPFWFEIDLSGPTRLSPALVKAVGLRPEPAGVMLSSPTGAIEEELKTDDIDIRISDATIKVSPTVISDRNLNAYTPVENYGGAIGVELLQHGALTIDVAHKRLILSPHGENYEATGGPGLPISLVEEKIGEHYSILAPYIELTFDGKAADFFLSSKNSGIEFLLYSKTGKAVLAKTPYRYKILTWSPDNATEGESGVAAGATIGDTALGARHAYRGLSPYAQPPEIGLNERHLFGDGPTWSKSRFSITDGFVDFTTLGSPFVRLDTVTQRIWLQAPDGDAAKGHAPRKIRPSTTIGITPWPYRDRVVVWSLVQGSPADLAGLRPGDEVLSLDGGDIYQYYKNLDPTDEDKQTKVVFRNRSGEHTVLLRPSTPKT
ncbi:MAG: hypothetical protein WA840_00255 [Caulobacteraceae bacterium]